MTDVPIAHSAPRPGASPQSYTDHVHAVTRGACERGEQMLNYYTGATSKRATIADTVRNGSHFHDLGKLDPQTQVELKKGRGARITWDHVDAGVAHLWTHGAKGAALIVRAHHSPGLPSLPRHFTSSSDRKLRGRRHDDQSTQEHAEQISRTSECLPGMLKAQADLLGPHQLSVAPLPRGLVTRLTLSCMVDADHSDSANFDHGWSSPEQIETRWPERLAALDAYVAELGSKPSKRNEERRRFYEVCRHGGPEASLVACDGPVGIGKTTSVTAYLLRRAITTKARRLVIVAPFTNILKQTAMTLREALLLPGEGDKADAVIAEHHHRADFQHISSRDLAALWAAPILLTTSVQFFETLSSNHPASLRKLHSLPGSVIFLDEAHAALPVTGTRLKPSTGERVETTILAQNWRWICELARDWSCSFVLASGSLARFWTVEDIVQDACTELPDLVPPTLARSLLATEARRVRFTAGKRYDSPALLGEAVLTAHGPRLLIMNTVHGAAAMAKHLRDENENVLHLSTALSPNDRDETLKLVLTRLDPRRGYSGNWTLVATSIMEAGIDVSFRSAFRERFGAASLIQIAGRVNRHLEWEDGGDVHDFIVSGLPHHPDARAPAEALAHLVEKGAFNGSIKPVELVTHAMRLELRQGRRIIVDHLGKAEAASNYPDVASLGRIIDADTRLVVVDAVLRDRVIHRDKIPVRDLLAGSVQIWSRKISSFRLEPIPGRDEIYWWPYEYDPTFLGFMAGALDLKSVASGELIAI